MPKYSLEKCARCGASARMIHSGMGLKARYAVECTQNGHMHRTMEFIKARAAARHWNADQKMVKSARKDGMRGKVDKGMLL